MTDGPELIVFGSLTTDNIITAAGDVLPQSYGGNCLYAALGARVWSDRVGIVSRYGDGFSREPIALLQRLGIDTAGIRYLGVPHARNMAFAYRADGSRTRVIAPELIERMPIEERGRFADTTLLPNADDLWQQFAPDGDDVPNEWWDHVAGVHCTFMPISKHRHIAETARRIGGPSRWIQVDSPLNDARHPEVDHLGPLLRLIDALLPSEVDVAAYRPGVPVSETALALVGAGAATVVLKVGAAGCRVYQSGVGLLAEIPAVDVMPNDPTGAGDAFCGGFLAGMHITHDVVTAARYGTVSASFAVESAGLTGLVASSRKEAGDRLRSIVHSSAHLPLS